MTETYWEAGDEPKAKIAFSWKPAPSQGANSAPVPVSAIAVYVDRNKDPLISAIQLASDDDTVVDEVVIASNFTGWVVLSPQRSAGPILAPSMTLYISGAPRLRIRG